MSRRNVIEVRVVGRSPKPAWKLFGFRESDDKTQIRRKPDSLSFQRPWNCLCGFCFKVRMLSNRLWWMTVKNGGHLLLWSSWCKPRCCSACFCWWCFLVCFFLQVSKPCWSVTCECLGPYPAGILESRLPSVCAGPTDAHPKSSRLFWKPARRSISQGARGKVKPISPMQFWSPLSGTRKANITTLENQTAIMNKFPL